MPHGAVPDAEDQLNRHLVELVSDLICVCRAGVITYINSAGSRMIGGAESRELLGRRLTDFIHPDFADIATLGLEALIGEPDPVPLILVRSDGKSIDVELTVQTLPGSDLTVAHARDITERTRAAEILLRSEERYRRLVELALDFTCVCNDGLITFINSAGVRMLGAGQASDLVGRPLADILHPDYRQFLDLGLGTLAEEADPVPLKFLGRDGRVIDVETMVMPLGGDSDQLFMMEARDISERKRSAEALREREQRLQGIMDSVAEGIVTADDSGTIQSFNPAAERIFGYKAAEVVGRNLSLLMPEPYRGEHDGYVAAYLRTNKPKVLGIGREVQGLRRDGTVFPMELNVAELRKGRQRLFIGVVRDITDRKRAEEALRRARDDLELRVKERTRELELLSRQNAQILNSANEGIIGLDKDGVIVFANPAAAAMTGRPVEGLVDRALAELIDPSLSARTRAQLLRAALGGRLPASVDMVFSRGTEGVFPVEFASAPIEEDGTAVGSVMVFRDVTERRRSEEKLRLAATVFETTAEAVIVMDADQRVTAVNPAFTEITGYSAEEVIGQLPSFLTGGTRHKEAAAALWEGVRKFGRWEGELWNRRKSGEDYAERLAVSSIADERGVIQQYVVVLSDITQRKLDEERIRYQANYDALTGLPNRALFLDRLNQAVSVSARSGQRVGLMFIDLDGFKLVNDTLGHDIGDRLLQEAGARLSSCVRSYDTVARLGGDEFTIIMPNLGDGQSAAPVAQRIIDSLEQPFDLVGQEALVSASIGITVFPDDAADAQTLLKNADAAMYRAKEHGKANYQFFTSDLNLEVTERRVIKSGLSKAFERGEFDLYYQPKISLSDGRITGVEGLLRWRSGERGMIPPAKFIPVMEETGLIGTVGEWAIEMACQQHREWAELGFPNIRVAVNLSVRQLRQAGLAQTIERMLDRAGITAAGLELEITESMIMKDTENAVSFLRELHEMGIHLAMDDFGTGYSSLSYLKRFPLHTIKIDRSFVADIVTDPDDLQIIRTIITMGHSLRRRIIAEGVETAEQKAILRRLRCDEIQGYLISPPVPAAEITRMLRRERGGALAPPDGRG